MIDRGSEDTGRGQVGIGTLIVFIAIVLVAAIAAGVLINTAGVLRSATVGVDGGSDGRTAGGLHVVTVVGRVDDGRIDRLNVTVTKRSGTDDIDLANLTVHWVGPDGATTLVHRTADGANTFATAPIKDADGSIDGTPVLNHPDDRARVEIDLDDPDNDLTPLAANETVFLTLDTQDGDGVRLRLGVPASLSGREVVEL